MAHLHEQRPLTGARIPSSNLSNNRRSPILQDPSRMDDTEARAEAGLIQSQNDGFKSYGEEYNDDKIGTSGKHTFANGKDFDDWDGVVHHARVIGKQWKRAWDRDGFNGLLSRARQLQISPVISTARVQSVVSTFAPRLAQIGSVIPPRRRALVAVVVTFIIILVRLSASSDSHRRLAGPASSALAVLSGLGVEAAIVDRTTGSHRGHNKAKVLESFSNPYGFINLIDPYAGGVFNPSVLVLPDAVGAGFRHLVAARGPEKYEVIGGEDTRWESVLGCFLTPLKRAHLNLPYLARESELETFKLPAKRKVDYLRCHNPDMRQFIGAEDPRLFFTNDGQPLMIYSQTGRAPNICRALFIIDARVVMPGLTDALKRAGWQPPIIFTEQTDLIREGQFNIEKNWSPFLGERDELFFHVSLVPQEIYKWVPGLTLRAMDPSPPTHNCLTSIIGAEMNRVKFHHATPLLRATMCRRGDCVPDIHNTVLFGIIHIKYHPLPYLFYERRVVTWNVTAPYEYLSVSKPLTYSGTNQADPIFTVSISWDHPTERHGLGLNHGFLDDVVMVSFGVSDYGSAYIDVLARDLLTEHELCTGFKPLKLGHN